MLEQNLAESKELPIWVKCSPGENCCLSCHSSEGSWTCLASLVRMQRGTPCLCKTSACAKWRYEEMPKLTQECGSKHLPCGLRSTLDNLLSTWRSLNSWNRTVGLFPLIIFGGLLTISVISVIPHLPPLIFKSVIWRHAWKIKIVLATLSFS